MGYLESSWKFLGIKQRDRPYYVDIIRENKQLPYLPNELWLLIDDALTLMNIEDHARRFMFRFERIEPFKRIFYLPFFTTYYAVNSTIRMMTGHRGIKSNRIVHFHDVPSTIVYSDLDTVAFHCRMRKLEAILNNVRVVEDF